MLITMIDFLVVVVACRLGERMQKKLNHFIFLGERHLRYVIGEYVRNYHERRYHQGIGGQLIQPSQAANDDELDGPIRCQNRLGGMLSYYYREAA